MRYLFGFLFLIVLVQTPAIAGKSVVECEEELGDAATDRRKVQECLYKSTTGLDLPPAAPVNQNAYVIKFGIDQVNSVGGVEPYVEFSNPNKNSAIKYAVFTLTLYNAVGDVVRSTIGGGTTKSLQFTGPLASADGIYPVQWGPVWYNPTGSCLVLQALSIEFMNGKKVNFSGKQLRSVLSFDIKNSCKVQ